jgi:hypothetical protein
MISPLATQVPLMLFAVEKVMHRLAKNGTKLFPLNSSFSKLMTKGASPGVRGRRPGGGASGVAA